MLFVPKTNIEKVTWYKEDGSPDGEYHSYEFGSNFHTMLRKFFDDPASGLLYAMIDDACGPDPDTTPERERNVWDHVVSHAFTCFVKSRIRVYDDNGKPTPERRHLTVVEALLVGVRRQDNLAPSKHLYRIEKALKIIPEGVRDEMNHVMMKYSVPRGFVENWNRLSYSYFMTPDVESLIHRLECFSREEDYSGRDNVFRLTRSDAKALTEKHRCADEIEKLLVEACAQFRFYEENHRAKNTEDSLRKAEVNNEIASRIEALLAK